MTKIKLCGLRTLEDVKLVNELLPDCCGFILSKGFGRTVALDDFKKLSAAVDKRIKKVGVFVNEPTESILSFAPFLDAVQLHGSEPPKAASDIKSKTGLFIIKAAKAAKASEIKAYDYYPCDMLLIDAYVKGEWGGTGSLLNVDEIIKSGLKRPFFAAGGLDTENVGEVIKKLSPYGVDCSSGIETDGKKDRAKAKAFVKAVALNSQFATRNSQ